MMETITPRDLYDWMDMRASGLRAGRLIGIRKALEVVDEKIRHTEAEKKWPLLGVKATLEEIIEDWKL